MTLMQTDSPVPRKLKVESGGKKRKNKEKKTKGGWRVFNGNELGALLGHWLVSNHLEANSTSNLSKLHLLASTVSSKFLDTLARAEGLTFTETLTGFKHMGNVSDKLIQRGNI